MTASIATNQTILVVGGGISGMTAALEAAECGKQVILVEKTPTLGGRTAQLYRYFPKMCHPTCGLEINLKRIKGNPNVRVMTMTEVTAVTGQRGNYNVTLKVAPRYVNENCTACGDCGKAVTSEVADAFNYGLGKVKAAYLPHAMAYPQRFVIDSSIVGTPDGDAAKAACKYGAVDLGMKEETVQISVGAVVWATGWRPFDANKIQPYGYDRYANVDHQRRVRAAGRPAWSDWRQDRCAPPTARKRRTSPSSSAPARATKTTCATARASAAWRRSKQTQYVREAYGDAGKSTVYYIDIRAIDRFEDFYQNVQKDTTVSFVKSKVARIAENEENGNPVLHGVDTEGYHRYATEHDLVVLAVGMEPEVTGVKLPADIILDSSNFIEGSKDGGMFGAGAASSPLDVNRSVQSATAASLKAIQVIHKSASTEAV